MVPEKPTEPAGRPAPEDAPGPLGDATGATTPTAVGRPDPSRLRAAAARVVAIRKRFGGLLSSRNLLLAAAAVVIAWTGVTGGWGSALEATPDELPTAAPTDTVEAAPLSVRVTAAFWTDDASALTYAVEDATFLIVRAEITAEVTEPLAFYDVPGSLHGTIPGTTLPAPSAGYSNSLVEDGSLGEPELFRVVDSQPIRALQPGMPQEYWLVWTLPMATEHAGTVRIEYLARTHRRSSLDASMLWTDPVPVAVQDLAPAANGTVG